MKTIDFKTELIMLEALAFQRAYLKDIIETNRENRRRQTSKEEIEKIDERYKYYQSKMEQVEQAIKVIQEN